MMNETTVNMIKKEVFISYKKTYNNQETLDATIAKQLSDALKSRGIGVFFSEDTLFEKGIGNYKKAIDKALDDALLMVVIGTKTKYVKGAWLEYEYETFYEDILSNYKPNSVLVSYVKGLDIKKLPRVLRCNQVFDTEYASVEKLTDFVVNAIRNIKNGQSINKVNPNGLDDVENGPSRKTPKFKYASDYFNEINRLKIQAKNSKESDIIAIDHIFNNCQWQIDEPLYVLDIGSAYGHVSVDRFSKNSRVKKILCIDNNSRVIERAQVLFAENEKMIFEVADVEDENFIENVQDLMLKHDIPKVHIVFSSLLLNHLTYPMQALRKFRKLMSNDSYILLRGSDDGSKLCYPNPELMKKIMKKGIEDGMLADRHNGSKLFTQLSDSGYDNIRIFSHMTDTSGLSNEEKESLFEESFSYRIYPYKHMLEQNYNDEEAKKKYKWMRDALTRFESQFFGVDFWYCEYDYVAVATIVPHSKKKDSQDLEVKE